MNIVQIKGDDNMRAIFESLFDAIYLITVVTIGIKMMREAKGKKEYYIFGLMAVVLGFGDAFHLIPRMIALLTTGEENYVVLLGIGKLITSITMTVFYVLLYYVYRLRYNVKRRAELTLTIYGLAILRILICLCPKNEFLSVKPPLSWAIYRNLPFLFLGIIIMLIFYKSQKEHKDRNFKYMWLTIFLSFAFYVPVVLYAQKYPNIGLLMIPKTCSYVWTVLLGYKDMKGDKNEKEIN